MIQYWDIEVEADRWEELQKVMEFEEAVEEILEGVTIVVPSEDDKLPF